MENQPIEINCQTCDHQTVEVYNLDTHVSYIECGCYEEQYNEQIIPEHAYTTAPVSIDSAVTVVSADESTTYRVLHEQCHPDGLQCCGACLKLNGFADME